MLAGWGRRKVLVLLGSPVLVVVVLRPSFILGSDAARFNFATANALRSAAFPFVLFGGG